MVKVLPHLPSGLAWRYLPFSFRWHKGWGGGVRFLKREQIEDKGQSGVRERRGRWERHTKICFHTKANYVWKMQQWDLLLYTLIKINWLSSLKRNSFLFLNYMLFSGRVCGGVRARARMLAYKCQDMSVEVRTQPVGASSPPPHVGPGDLVLRLVTEFLSLLNHLIRQ